MRIELAPKSGLPKSPNQRPETQRPEAGRHIAHRAPPLSARLTAVAAMGTGNQGFDTDTHGPYYQQTAAGTRLRLALKAFPGSDICDNALIRGDAFFFFWAALWTEARCLRPPLSVARYAHLKAEPLLQKCCIAAHLTLD
jgi:hypothetical protein